MDDTESVEWDGQEGHVAAASYSDPDRLALEFKHVLRRQPLCLGHADQLREPGTVLARDIFALP